MNILTTGMGWIDHTPGGLNRYFADYTLAMQQQGHNIRALVTAGGEKISAPPYMEEVLTQSDKTGTWDRVRAFRTAAAQTKKQWRPDVYNPHFALYASLIGRGQLPANIPIVTHFHGPWAKESMIEDKSSFSAQQINYQIKKKVESLAYNRSNRFIVLSEYFSSLLQQDYGIPGNIVHIVPGAVDTERFKPSSNRQQLRKELGFHENDRVLFCVRRLVRRMGIDRLIHAMSEISAQVPEAILIIAGDGTMRDELKALSAKLELTDKIRFVGRVSNEELVQWYQAADVSVVPTVTLEGFGLVTVEALACGTPVVGTPNGGTKEILQQFDSNLLFDDDTPEAMSSRIISLLKSEKGLPERERCRSHVMERYTWEKIANGVSDVFHLAAEDSLRRA
ncbi:glycosyltransferase family 4 protein [Paenibacillus herberti]|uniref:Group 1 glycosyl transferase n=1 Tax=Paenibacillus herberti TaxID=1619309 RepID=A0A229NV23_9BACL|nr:glycosyltransferase family 4 protein [Paenibacillus herberti]OXM13722.1 group 1 glycosyl transferase [Paenibacillus herberti]